MWPGKKKKVIDPYLLKKVEHLVRTVASMKRVAGICGFSMRIQGRCPITNGTRVAYYKPRVETLNELKHLIHAIFFGVDAPGIKDLIERVDKKVSGGYACCIEVGGYDHDGDAIDYKLKFDSQEEMVEVLKHGLFSLEDKKHSKYLLIE